METIYLITDYRDAFYSSVRNYRGLCSMDTGDLSRLFERQGFDLVIRKYPEIDLAGDEYRGRYVLYQSSEDPGLRYKSYIEDIICGLGLKEAILIPPYPMLRAHHNKVFMEIMRDISINREIKALWSRKFGTYEDFENAFLSYPSVIKPAEGAGSRGVGLLRNERDKKRLGRVTSRVFDLWDAVLEKYRRLTRKCYTARSQHRNKFIVQEFVGGLEDDYKVLAFFDKYYVLNRRNRKGDFRASGSGDFEKPVSVPCRTLGVRGADVQILRRPVHLDGHRL